MEGKRKKFTLAGIDLVIFTFESTIISSSKSEIFSLALALTLERKL